MLTHGVAVRRPHADVAIRLQYLQREFIDLLQRTRHLEQKRKDSDANNDDVETKTAQQAYQTELNRIAREAAARSLLRAVYSPN